jgi:hypothetical protein
MTPLSAAPNRKRARDPLSADKIAVADRLSRLAASPWALACSSFLLTALLIRSDGLIF